jgi:hypothetical protein
MKLSVSDKEGKHLGDLELTRALVTWHKDRDTLKVGESFKKKKFRWDNFINLMEGHGVAE